MADKRWDGADYQDLSTRKHWNGTSWVDLTIAKHWNGTVWVDIPIGGGGGFSVTLNRGSIFAGNFDPLPAPLTKKLTTTAVTATAVGGAGPPATYAWTKVSGDSAVQANSPTSNVTTFSATLGQDTFKEAVWRVTATRGADVAVADIPVSFSYSTDR